MSQPYYDDPESLLPLPDHSQQYPQTQQSDETQRFLLQQQQYQQYMDEQGLNNGGGGDGPIESEEEAERREELKMALEQVPDEVKKVSRPGQIEWDISEKFARDMGQIKLRRGAVFHKGATYRAFL